MTNLDDIYANIPGYTDAAERLDKLKAIPLPTTRALSAAEALAMDLAANPSGAKLLSAAQSAIAEIDSVVVARSALTMARQQLERTLSELRTSHPDVILTTLDAALGDLTTEVATFDDLASIVDADAAFAADRTADYKRLRAIAGRYSLIRNRQALVMREQTGGTIDLPEALISPDLRTVFPLWAPWRSHGQLIHKTTGQSRDIRPPWPVPGDVALNRGMTSASRSTFEKDANRPEFLIWAIEAGVRLWVPTLDQYAAAGREYHQALERDARPEVIEDDWIDPGGVSTGAPTRNPERHPLKSASFV